MTDTLDHAPEIPTSDLDDKELRRRSALFMGNPLLRPRNPDFYGEFVYFARLKEWIKIGYTTDWRQRWQALERDTPYNIGQFIVIRGSRDRERALHAQFAHLRGSGEWFESAPDLEGFLKAIPPTERVR